MYKALTISMSKARTSSREYYAPLEIQQTVEEECLSKIYIVFCEIHSVFYFCPKIDEYLMLKIGISPAMLEIGVGMN